MAAVLVATGALALGGALALVMGAFALGMTEARLRSVSLAATMASLVTILAAAHFVALHLVLVRRRGVTWTALGFRPVAARVLLRTPLRWLRLLPGYAAAIAAVTLLLPGPVENPRTATYPAMMASPGELLLLLLGAGVVVPVLEEVFFRGLVQRWLRGRIGPRPAVVLSAAAFAAVHAVPLLMATALVLGVGCGAAAERHGSLLPAIALHAFNNGVALLLFATVVAP